MAKYPLFLWYPFFSGFGKIIELLKIVICSNVPLQNKAICYDLSANVFSILIGKRNNELFCFAITASRILHNATSMNPLLLVFPKIGSSFALVMPGFLYLLMLLKPCLLDSLYIGCNAP